MSEYEDILTDHQKILFEAALNQGFVNFQRELQGNPLAMAAMLVDPESYRRAVNALFESFMAGVKDVFEESKKEQS